jgi:hypothetical protein
MKTRVTSGLLLAGMFAAGCAAQNKPVLPAPAANVPPAVIITPDNSIAGNVIYYESTGRFVVVNFPAGQMPAMGQILFLYRSGLKTAEVKITGPQGYGNIVADLLTGDVKAGDEVRDQ